MDANGDGAWAIALRVRDAGGRAPRCSRAPGSWRTSLPEREVDETGRSSGRSSIRCAGASSDRAGTEPTTAYPIVVKVLAGLGALLGLGLAGSVIAGVGAFVLLPIGLAIVLVSVLLFRNAHSLIGG